jgi:hypothetical protein
MSKKKNIDFKKFMFELKEKKPINPTQHYLIFTAARWKHFIKGNAVKMTLQELESANADGYIKTENNVKLYVQKFIIG